MRLKRLSVYPLRFHLKLQLFTCPNPTLNKVMKRQIFTSNDNLALRHCGRPLSLVVLALGLIGGNVNAQLAAVPCGTSVLDFGEGPPDSATLPPNMGESSPTNVAVALRGVSPSKVGWYSQARDHTTENTTGTGYFLAIDSYNLLLQAQSYTSCR